MNVIGHNVIHLVLASSRFLQIIKESYTIIQITSMCMCMDNKTRMTLTILYKNPHLGSIYAIFSVLVLLL